MKLTQKLPTWLMLSVLCAAVPRAAAQQWQLVWSEQSIRLFLDDELLNEIPLATTVNGSIGNHANPFTEPQYILLNLALGGDNGGPIDDSALPMRYEIDYVRVYEKVDLVNP